METYQIGGQWFARASGGHANRHHVPAQEIGPFPLRPEPTASWVVRKENACGRMAITYTRFAVGGGAHILLCRRSWDPAGGYSWSEQTDTFEADQEPPALEEAYEWRGDGWAAAPHPVAVPS